MLGNQQEWYYPFYNAPKIAKKCEYVDFKSAELAYAASRCRLSPTKNAITKVPASKLAEPCHYIFDLACSLAKVSL